MGADDRVDDGAGGPGGSHDPGSGRAVGGSGGAATAGYEYQIDVSVWLALDLVLATKLTRELVLEPASEEDIEADLAESEPGRVTSQASLDGYRLIVQAKLRTGDAWTARGLAALLRHGEARASAAERLADPCARYLLVTSAALNGGARSLRVRSAAVWPKAADMPAAIANVLPAGSAGRVAIIGNQDDERLTSDIKALLTERFRVPNARWQACHRALREEARMRIGGAGGGRWDRADLEHVIRRHDGYLAMSPELEHYVRPTNWDDLRAALRDRHAALILGQSGTGKTTAVKKLYEELRGEVPGLAHVAITLGPQQLRSDDTAPPVLYEVEDPWGRFDFDPASRPWNDQLARLFAAARPDQLIVATSRLDVVQSAGALDDVRPWIVGLESEHYGPAERRRLYRTRINALPRDRQGVAKQSEAPVLAELATPLEIQKFFDALTTLDPAGAYPRGLIAEAIGRAHQESIERTVVEQIEERDDVRAAAVLWGMLKANGRLPLRLLRRLEEELADREPQLERGVSPLVGFFIAARNLRQTESAATYVTYYHPRVEAGVEGALRRHRLVTQRTLRVLVDVLLALDAPGEAWGVATAARLVAGVAGLPDVAFQPAPAAQARIDAWLADALAPGGREFGETLALAAAVGSVNSAASEVARLLLHRPDSSFEGMDRWGPLPHDEAWYARMRADPAVKPLVETFIRDVLPTERGDFPLTFVAQVRRLASGLTAAFRTAADYMVEFGATLVSDVIAEGALEDLDGFESVVDAAVVVLTPTPDQHRETEAIHLAIINGEYSEDYAEHLAEDDSGYTAGEFLEAYVARVRATVGWARLADHRHRDRLLRYWLRALAKEDRPAPDEVAGAFALAYGSEYEDDLWGLLTTAWQPRFLDALVGRVADGGPAAGACVAALACLVQRAPDQLPAVCRALEVRDDRARLVDLAIELGALRHERWPVDGGRRTEAATAARDALPDRLAEISDAAYASEVGDTPTLSAAARGYLETTPHPSEALRTFRVRLDAHVPFQVDEDVRWLLANTTESTAALAAITAAVRHHMGEEVRGGLQHRFAAVVARALAAVATPLPAPLPADLLALAHAKGSPVRTTLVELLATKPHSDHLPALLHLAKDRWSQRAGSYGEEEVHPIARAAVAAIGDLGVPTTAAADQLYQAAIDSRDPGVLHEIFALLVVKGGAGPQEQIFDLAVTPGRVDLRIKAADALLAGGREVSPEVLARITPRVLETRASYVAARLTLLLAARGHPDALTAAIETLAANPDRRVLVLLALRVLRDRDRDAADRIAATLPREHPAVGWALGGGGAPTERTLEDLGDALTVAHVLPLMQAMHAATPQSQ